MPYTLNAKPIPYTPSPNWRMDTDGEPPRFIVLHSTGGGWSSAVNWLRSKLSGVSAHFVVGRDGQAVQLVDTRRVAWHAGKSAWGGRTNLNGCSIGIEMVHVDGKQDWPKAQIMAVAELCAQLCIEFGIPRDKILGHSMIAPGRKVDPLNFPWGSFADLCENFVSLLKRRRRGR